MTAIYVPLPLDGYELCHPTNPEDFEVINVTINGELRSGSWRSPKMRILHQDQGRALASSDSPWLGSRALVFRSRALGPIHRLLEAHGELLPLDCEGADVVLYNATRVVDALDEAASAISRFDDGKIMMVRRHVFRRDLLRGIDIFKIPSLRVSPTFVNRVFVDAWEASGATGLRFKQVWAPN
jgi:hypothetical protein